MNSIKLQEQLLVLLPIDIINYILLFSGYHKWRNGMYIVQIDKTNNIFNMLKNMSLFTDWFVKLHINTQLFNKTLYDKIITLYKINIITPNTEYSNSLNDDDSLLKVYDCSWYEYNEIGKYHFKTIEKIYL
jgi:hypothetical protein